MKFTNTLVALLFIALITSLSCKKNTQPPVQDTTPRKVRFVLYTSKDFSSDDKTITFSLRIGSNPHLMGFGAGAHENKGYTHSRK